jgi:hypothetical protein
VIVRRIHEDVFLTFASNQPYFVTEVNEEAEEMILQYFPEGAVDVIPLAPGEEVLYDKYYDEEEEEEEEAAVQEEEEEEEG